MAPSFTDFTDSKFHPINLLEQIIISKRENDGTFIGTKEGIAYEVSCVYNGFDIKKHGGYKYFKDEIL